MTFDEVWNLDSLEMSNLTRVCRLAPSLLRERHKAPASPTGSTVVTNRLPIHSDALLARPEGCQVPSMLDWTQCTAVERIAGKVSGAWVFRGTRVPVRALFENLEGGARIEDFLEWFPGVTREQVLAVLRHAEETLAESVA
ncbi:MAG: DUF433 domain-containing protein [Verrucomicrobiales bacterium]|nr:DUF433 domain-containing protein [Verrucomicrobiales bacterium]